MSLFLYDRWGIKIEKKIIDAKPIVSVPEIIVPESAVYSNGDFVVIFQKRQKVLTIMNMIIGYLLKIDAI